MGQFEGATTHIRTAEEAFAEPTDVYDLSGRLVGSRLRNLDKLPAGTYIVNGHKIIKQ